MISLADRVLRTPTSKPTFSWEVETGTVGTIRERI